MKSVKLKPFEIILIFVCIILLFISYLSVRKRKQIFEIQALPFTNTLIENVVDGTYEGSVQTTFLCVKVQVDVKDQKIADIQLLEKSGTKKTDKSDELFQTMIKENKAFVPVMEKEELVDLVYICAVDNALSKGNPQLLQENEE